MSRDNVTATGRQIPFLLFLNLHRHLPPTATLKGSYCDKKRTECTDAAVVHSLQIPLLSTNAKEQAFNSLGEEQSTAHCNCHGNVECNNVSLWRVSHLQTLNVFCVCLHRCSSDTKETKLFGAVHLQLNRKTATHTLTGRVVCCLMWPG